MLLIIAIIGVSYAAFNYSGLGTKVNTITTGSITMTYTESSNTISLNGALPTTDETGMKRLNPGEYFDFTVSSEITGNVNINYEISAKDVTTSDRKIDGSNIKLYLTEIVDGEEQEVMSPKVYNEEAASNEYTGRPSGEMSLYTSSMNSSEEHHYRLRMYVTEEYNPQGDGGGLQFSVKINVYGKDGDKPPTAVDTLLAKVNAEDLDYNSASSEQQKEMWTFTHPATEQTEALTDYRYIGSAPNNYVTFNDEVWRIIGVFTVDDGTGNKEERIKIIRDERIGRYLWDNKLRGIGSSTSSSGSNNWSDARLNYLLNPRYESEEIGGSLYWNSGSGTCYSGFSNATESCDFTSTGLKEEAKNMIGDTLWYLGGASSYTSDSNGLASHWYSYERGTTVYSGRDTSWVGKVGLMYPSDYGYATSGGSTTDRKSCLNKELFNWRDVSDCYNNDWLLFNSTTQWTLTSNASSPYNVFDVYSNGEVNNGITSYKFSVRPVVFLKSNIKIVDGDGSSSNPYILQS